MQPASRGDGGEEYRLRYPVDLGHTFSMPAAAVEKRIGAARPVRIEKTLYGFMIEIGGFSSEDSARVYALHLELELRRLCIENKFSMFFPAEVLGYEKYDPPVSLLGETYGNWKKDDAEEIFLDGCVPSTMACIVPEHLKIVYIGEIRGFFSLLVPTDKIQMAVQQASENYSSSLSPLPEGLKSSYKLAADFFSLACARHAPPVCIIHLVICLEILASAVGIKDGGIHGTRKLFSMFDVENTLPRLVGGRTRTDKELSAALHMMRGNIVHRGSTPGDTGDDVVRVLDAGLDASAAILLKLVSNTGNLLA